MDNTEGLTGEEEEVLALQRESVDQSAHDMVRGRWSDFEKRRDYVRPEPIPLRKQYFPDIPKPEPKSKYYENFNELDLRAIVEKRRMRERSNVLWKQRMDAAGTTRYLNLTPKTDYRLQRHGEEPRDWTHEEMMNFITNHGQNADPFKIKIGVNDPLGRLDYFEQGVEWIDETEDFLAKRGHWQEDVAELQHDPDISTLDSTFANFDEAGGEAEMDAPESQESVPLAADDEDTGLGDAEDGSLGGYF
ncbi:hypothetical protein WJX72_008470 [[Myrmecia] bisecta]|uniref:Uncharacterized protein n=1 Tax=[Myrmecia] bisecta TaxID=41462 RepID=A0AAW1QRX7_9CHLO